MRDVDESLLLFLGRIRDWPMYDEKYDILGREARFAAPAYYRVKHRPMTGT